MLGGIRDTRRYNAGRKPVRGVCDDDTQDASHMETKGCWEHPRVPGAVLEARSRLTVLGCCPSKARPAPDAPPSKSCSSARTDSARSWDYTTRSDTHVKKVSRFHSTLDQRRLL